ncbi:prepilin peptidase [Maricaulis sp.]|uniref:prepilin peptidase n=1 Tax=Maricaulis sp. TaxID=1486257 RepID=UPI002617BD3D|nr:prepilin peptidase [Maricaulis sp.]
MDETAFLALVGIASGVMATLTGLATASSMSIWRRRRRRNVFLLALAIAIAMAMTFGWVARQPVSSLIFAGACGTAASAAALDLAIRRVHDLGTFAVALAGLAHAALTSTLMSSLVASAGSMAILGLAGLVTTVRRGSTALGLGDILFACACGLWVNPALLAPALLMSVAASVVIERPWRSDASVRIAFVPGLALGYGIAAVGAQIV